MEGVQDARFGFTLKATSQCGSISKQKGVGTITQEGAMPDFIDRAVRNPGLLRTKILIEPHPETKTVCK